MSPICLMALGRPPVGNTGWRPDESEPVIDITGNLREAPIKFGEHKFGLTCINRVKFVVNTAFTHIFFFSFCVEQQLLDAVDARGCGAQLPSTASRTCHHGHHPSVRSWDGQERCQFACFRAGIWTGEEGGDGRQWTSFVCDRDAETSPFFSFFSWVLFWSD